MTNGRSANVRRTFGVRSTIVLAALACASLASAQSSPGVVGEVRVHGNHTTPNADILGIVGDIVGKPATEGLMAEIQVKLERSGRFDGVEVRKRFRSIENPDDILLMIIVDEVPGIDPLDLTPGPMKKFWSSGMFMPILSSEDGYGFTYGMRTSFVDLLGPRSRVSVPLTWGGERQARVQLERSFKSGVIERVSGEFGLARRTNPHYGIAERRLGYAARAESAPARWLRLGIGGRRDEVRFEAEDTVTRFGGDLAVDTRVDPAFPRNAVHATIGLDRVTFDAGDARQKKADVRGYLGVFGQAVLAVRGLSITTSAPLPPYEHNLLGGASNLRGYEAGFKAGDNLVALSAELRLPVTSPMSVGRFGIKAFVDAGAVYGVGERLKDQSIVDRGIGGGAYLHLTVVSLALDIARSRAGDTRYHFGMGVTFK